ncbi:glycosyltransferase family 2 protein [Flavobacteriaceae bacterium S356]|uniref:Glycosyltransferase family 2 protein n=1 Tax=Asprobacillus argus TaxID=3076534 RepID=A0ABU3LE06_9FLAO|nr:glycosyltransferase family 2 protein [Flavobacteriaceae bacterium S356]
MKEAVVSIIIPLYNREKLIIETIESILAQTFEEWECIIVDDHSTDNSYEVVEIYAKKDRRIQVFKRPDRLKKGANSCRNYGFSKSKGAYIQWFDSDDLMLPEMLTLKLNAFQSHYDFVACKFSTFEQGTDNMSVPNFELNKGLIPDYLCGDIPINTPMVLWKRSIVEKEKFNENLTRAQELDFISRVFIFKNPNGILLDKNLIKVREHDASITGEYNAGGKIQIRDEVNVRFNIHYLYEGYKKATLYGYYKALKKALQNRFYRLSIAHLLKTLFKIEYRFSSIQLKLLFVAISLAIFGKGLERYKSIIKKYE